MLFAASKISWLHEISVIHLLIALLWVALSKYLVNGLNAMPDGLNEWYSWCVLFIKSKRTSRKPPVFQFVLTVILIWQLLKIWIFSFPFHLISGPEEFCYMPGPLYSLKGSCISHYTTAV